jgi:DDE superfamily endonuclease
MISHLFLMKGTRCLVRLLHFNPAFPKRSSRQPSALWPNEWLPCVVGNGLVWSYFSMTIRSSPTCRQAARSVCPIRRSAFGDDDGPAVIFPLRISRAADASPAFPPFAHAQVKATACELVSQTDQPLSRQSTADITRRVNEVLERPMSTTTVWRTLKRDAIQPWRYRYWIFPRDPRFGPQAAAILDLYAGLWQGEPLGRNDFVLSSDEKTSIQARIRCHASLAPRSAAPLCIEPEYKRGGALQYLAAWDVGRGRVFGRCEAHTGIASFARLVDQVMQQQPYCHADRVFWIVDNGSSHRGECAVKRLEAKYPNAIMVHTPVHASWLNQIEIYFSIIQRKVLTPNDFLSLAAVEERLTRFEQLHNAHPTPFHWKFDREQLNGFMTRLNKRRMARGEPPLDLAEQPLGLTEQALGRAA